MESQLGLGARDARHHDTARSGESADAGSLCVSAGDLAGLQADTHARYCQAMTAYPLWWLLREITTPPERMAWRSFSAFLCT
jgi:hypothetical protein